MAVGKRHPFRLSQSGWSTVSSRRVASDLRSHNMIWKNYVFRHGIAVEDLWDQMFADRRATGRPLSLLYVAGKGFDVRANVVATKYVERLLASECEVGNASLLLVGFSGYQLSPELQTQTAKNAAELEETFRPVGGCEAIVIGGSAEGEDDISATVALRRGADEVLRHVSSQTDIVLDVSSLPRIAYLTILLTLLAKIIPQGSEGEGLAAKGVTLQVLVAEDAALDSQISSEDPSNDLVLIPGYPSNSDALEQLREPRIANAAQADPSLHLLAKNAE